MHPATRDTVLIVDSRPGDYAPLLEHAAGAGLDLAFCHTGESALDRRWSQAARVRIVNIDLPDIAGLQLVQAWQQRGESGPFFVVADDYRPELEFQVLQQRGVYLLTKPLPADLIVQISEDLSSRTAAVA